MKALISSIILILASSLSVFAQTSETSCPEFELVLPKGLIEISKSVNISVKSNQNIENFKLNYEWITSIGKIVKGQGTSEIVFLSDENIAGNVRISLRVSGLPKECSNVFLEDYAGIAPEIIGDPYDQIGKVSIENYKYRLDSFFIVVSENPNYEGLITIRFDINDSRNYKLSRLRAIQQHLNLRKYDVSRFTFAIFEDEYQEESIYWIIPPDAKFPKYTKNYTIIKGEDLKKSIKNLFPLK